MEVWKNVLTLQVRDRKEQHHSIVSTFLLEIFGLSVHTSIWVEHVEKGANIPSHIQVARMERRMTQYISFRQDLRCNTPSEWVLKMAPRWFLKVCETSWRPEWKRKMKKLEMTLLRMQYA